MRPTFNQTVDVLVKAYLNNTLMHGNCAACAVGNIIASSIGAEVKADEYAWFRKGVEISPIWDEVFCSNSPGSQEIYPSEYKGWVKRQIDASGYSWQDLAAIEKAFELNHPCTLEEWTEDIEDKAMFNGLMAVVDVLADIHGVDLTVKESAKLLFIK